MSDYLSPRRFARMFEMSRNGWPTCGTLPEQRSVRNVFDGRLASYDSPLDRTLFAVDKALNENGYHFIPISIENDPNFPLSLWGQTSGFSIPLIRNGSPLAQRAWDFVVLHEFGHVAAIHLLGRAHNSEDWARMFQEWAMGGQQTYHPVWLTLEPYCPTVSLS